MCTKAPRADEERDAELSRDGEGRFRGSAAKLDVLRADGAGERQDQAHSHAKRLDSGLRSLRVLSPSGNEAYSRTLDEVWPAVGDGAAGRDRRRADIRALGQQPRARMVSVASAEMKLSPTPGNLQYQEDGVEAAQLEQQLPVGFALRRRRNAVGQRQRGAATARGSRPSTAPAPRSTTRVSIPQRQLSRRGA
jgi:hypothetical protein